MGCVRCNIGRRRRLKPLAAASLDASPTESITPSKVTDSTALRKYYTQRYERSKGICIAVQLYAESTDSHIDRMESAWREYVLSFLKRELLLTLKIKDSVFLSGKTLARPSSDPRQTLEKCGPARIDSFLHWYLKQSEAVKTSSLETY